MVSVIKVDYYDLEETINTIKYENILNIVPVVKGEFTVATAFLIIYKQKES